MLLINTVNHPILRSILDHDLVKGIKQVIRFNQINDYQNKGFNHKFIFVVARSNAFQNKIYISIYEDKILLTGLRRNEIKVNNFLKDYNEVGSLEINFTDPDIAYKAAAFIEMVMSEKSDYVLAKEAGRDCKLETVHSFTLLNENNVFSSRVKSVMFGPDKLTLTTEHGKIVFTGQDIEKIINLDNVLGKFIIMNSNKEFIIVQRFFYLNITKGSVYASKETEEKDTSCG